MMYLSEHRAAAAGLARGRRLSMAETRAANALARARWDAMSDAEKNVYVQRYQDWLAEPPPEAPREEVNTYRSHWGGGSKSCLVTPSEFCSYIKQRGWPRDDDIYNASGKYVHDPCGDVGFNEVLQFNLWGCSRLPRNICRGQFGDVRVADLVHGSLSNLIERLGRRDAYSAGVLLVFRGKRLADDDSLARTLHIVGFLVGAMYNPRVSDWALCRFESPDGVATMEDLPLPCDMQLDEAQCRL